MFNIIILSLTEEKIFITKAQHCNSQRYSSNGDRKLKKQHRTDDEGVCIPSSERNDVNCYRYTDMCPSLYSRHGSPADYRYRHNTMSLSSCYRVS